MRNIRRRQNVSFFRKPRKQKPIRAQVSKPLEGLRPRRPK